MRASCRHTPILKISQMFLTNDARQTAMHTVHAYRTHYAIFSYRDMHNALAWHLQSEPLAEIPASNLTYRPRERGRYRGKVSIRDSQCYLLSRFHPMCFSNNPVNKSKYLRVLCKIVMCIIAFSNFENSILMQKKKFKINDYLK